MAKLLIRLHLVAFRCISNPHPRLDSSLRWNDGAQGAGMRGSRLRGNDVCEQCSNHGGYGVRGSCRWFGMAVAGRWGDGWARAMVALCCDTGSWTGVQRQMYHYRRAPT